MPSHCDTGARLGDFPEKAFTAAFACPQLTNVLFFDFIWGAQEMRTLVLHHGNAPVQQLGNKVRKKPAALGGQREAAGRSGQIAYPMFDGLMVVE